MKIKIEMMDGETFEREFVDPLLHIATPKAALADRIFNGIKIDLGLAAQDDYRRAIEINWNKIFEEEK